MQESHIARNRFNVALSFAYGLFLSMFWFRKVIVVCTYMITKDMQIFLLLRIVFILLFNSILVGCHLILNNKKKILLLHKLIISMKIPYYEVFRIVFCFFLFFCVAVLKQISDVLYAIELGIEYFH